MSHFSIYVSSQNTNLGLENWRTLKCFSFDLKQDYENKLKHADKYMNWNNTKCRNLHLNQTSQMSAPCSCIKT